jgi:hypothetical protein
LVGKNAKTGLNVERSYVSFRHVQTTLIREEKTMKHVRLITTAIALSIAATGLSAINAAEQQSNPKGITIKLPDQIPWKRNAASAVVTAASNETALLYGDPTKSGTYVYRSKFAPVPKTCRIGTPRSE